MKLYTKSEWFVLDSPLCEPNQKWKENDPYYIERSVQKDGSIVWLGIGKNWKKEVGGNWTELSVNDNAKPLDKYLPEIVYGEDRTYWKECPIPTYEDMYEMNINNNYINILRKSLILNTHSTKNNRKYDLSVLESIRDQINLNPYNYGHSNPLEYNIDGVSFEYKVAIVEDNCLYCDIFILNTKGGKILNDNINNVVFRTMCSLTDYVDGNVVKIDNNVKLEKLYFVNKEEDSLN